MALPTILFNTSTGSDTAASGAGPSTALTGSSASTSGDGLTVTLDGSPDLSGVATDGSHVIYLADTTAGARNFGKITAVDNGAKTVTVSNAFGVSLSGKSWAIGGKRATVGHTDSVKLLENNNASGDAMPGWIVEMESGHTETIGATIEIKRAGDETDGPIVWRGTLGAATPPIVSFSNNGVAIDLWNTQYKVIEHFELRNTNATKTASRAFSDQGSTRAIIRNMKCSHASDNFWKVISDWRNVLISHCDFGFTASDVVTRSTAASTQLVIINNCWIHDGGGAGITCTGALSHGMACLNNLITDNAGAGIIDTHVASGITHSYFLGNSIANNTGNGLTFSGDAEGMIIDNLFSGNGGYGVSIGSLTVEKLQACLHMMRNNAFYANTSGKYESNLTDLSASELVLTADPYVNAAASDYSVNDTAGGGAELRSKEYAIGSASGQFPFRQWVADSFGGGGLLVHPGMSGGMRG